MKPQHLLALALAATFPAAAFADYTPVDLGAFTNTINTFFGGGAMSGATAINDNGDVVGFSSKMDGATLVTRPFLWTTTGGMQDLGSLGFTKATAAGINNSGQVVGYLSESGVGAPPFAVSSATGTAFIWDSTNGMRPLATFGGVGTSVPNQARGINDSGLIAGYARDSSGYQTVVTWNASNIATGTNLVGNLGAPFTGTYSAFGLGVNQSGDIIIETSSTLPGGPSNVNWKGGYLKRQPDGTYLTIPIQHTQSVFPRGISNSGLVTGFDTNFVGFLWNSNTQAFTLMPTNGYNFVQPAAVNDSGTVVGYRSNGSSTTAFIYKNGITYNLNDLIDPASGMTITAANAINNAGQIVGYGTNAQGHSHAVLLNGNLPGFSLTGATASGGTINPASTSSSGLGAGDMKFGPIVSFTNFELTGNFATVALSFDPAAILAAGGDPDSLRLQWYNTATSTWTLAGNASNNTKNPAAHFVLGAPDSILGDWGIDTTNHLVWANIDHASAYGLIGLQVPEPASLTLLAAPALLLLLRRRK